MSTEMDRADEYYRKELAGWDINSCADAYPHLADELDCWVCGVAGECLPDLFSIDEDPNPREVLVDIPTEALQEYSDLLSDRTQLHRSDIRNPSLARWEKKKTIFRRRN